MGDLKATKLHLPIGGGVFPFPLWFFSRTPRSHPGPGSSKRARPAGCTFVFVHELHKVITTYKRTCASSTVSSWLRARAGDGEMGAISLQERAALVAAGALDARANANVTACSTVYRVDSSIPWLLQYTPVD